MLHTTNTDAGASRHEARLPVTAAERRLRNIRAFEANLGALKAAFPGLRHERTGTQIEWFVRASRPLSGPGLGLSGDLALDIPCSEDTAEILDSMAFANDATLDRPALDRALAEEMAYLSTRLDHAIDHLHRFAKRDIEAGGLRAQDYLRALSSEIGGKAVNLYPAWSQDEGKSYRPGQHIRDRVKAACATALREARSTNARDKSRSGAKGRAGPKSEPSRRNQRPFRMRRYSALYD